MTAAPKPLEPILSIHRSLMEVKYALATINAILPARAISASISRSLKLKPP